MAPNVVKRYLISVRGARSSSHRRNHRYPIVRPDPAGSVRPADPPARPQPPRVPGDPGDLTGATTTGTHENSFPPEELPCKVRTPVMSENHHSIQDPAAPPPTTTTATGGVAVEPVSAQA